MSGQIKRRTRNFLLCLTITAVILQCSCVGLPVQQSADSSARATGSPTPTTTSTTLTPFSLSNPDSMLTSAQEARLYAASQKYLAPTQTDAIKVAQSMNFLGVNGFPSTMCGPLAMAILRDAGLADADIDLSRFFYLNPRPGAGDTIIASAFPDDLYQKIEVNSPINQVDFSAHPLMPGDFVYLFAGARGNFDHIITVSRVDADGRAYAVTNLNTSKGYVINEVMLYDPAKPGVGQFYEWTDKKNASLGLTGFGGFWLWRLRAPQPDPDARTLQFQQAIEDEEKSSGGEWHILIKELGKEPLYSSLIYDSIHPASTIKLADAILFFKALEKKNVGEMPTISQNMAPPAGLLSNY